MKLRVLVVPMDSGIARWRMGAGPERLIDCGVLAPFSSTSLSIERYETQNTDKRGEVGSAFDIARWLAARVAAARREGAFPGVLAGNCISSLGTFAGICASGTRDPGVCWFDAHADFNTPETTLSGFLDGMALATLAGRCWTTMTRSIAGFQPVKESHIRLFGARDIDDGEQRLLEDSDARLVAVGEDSAVLTKTLGALRERTPEVYLHVDLDVLDPDVARVNQYATADGYRSEQLLDVIGQIATRFRIGALALTAYDPSFDAEGRVPPVAAAILQRACAV